MDTKGSCKCVPHTCHTHTKNTRITQMEVVSVCFIPVTQRTHRQNYTMGSCKCAFRIYHTHKNNHANSNKKTGQSTLTSDEKGKFNFTNRNNDTQKKVSICIVCKRIFFLIIIIHHFIFVLTSATKYPQ